LFFRNFIYDAGFSSRVPDISMNSKKKMKIRNERDEF